jgi:bifunctional non-homologous end joining protein LigD
VEAVESLPVQSCFVDGEAIMVDHTGLSVFDLLRYRQHVAPLCSAHSILSSLTAKTCASSRIEERKHALANVLYRERNGIVFNMHYDGDGSIVFKQACALGCKGIVSKRLGSPYRSGRTDHWLKIKNPKAPAVKREAERQAPGTRAEK